MTWVCDELEEALEQTAQITSRRSFLGVLKVPLASELTLREIFSYNPALVGQNVHVNSGHIRFIKFCILSVFLRIIGNFLLNNGIDMWKIIIWIMGEFKGIFGPGLVSYIVVLQKFCSTTIANMVHLMFASYIASYRLSRPINFIVLGRCTYIILQQK